MYKSHKIFIFFLFAFLFTLFSVADLNSVLYSAQLKGTKNVQVEAIPQYNTIQQKEDVNFLIGLRFKLASKWHIYWENPGDSGMKTEIIWQTPKNSEFNYNTWPSPEKIYVEPIMTYGYEDEVFVLSSFSFFKNTSSPNNKNLSLKLKAKIKWLECREICLPGKANLEVNIGLSDHKLKPNVNPLFTLKQKEHEYKYPKKNTLIKAEAGYNKNDLNLTIEGINLNKPSLINPKFYFFIDKPGIIQHLPEQSVNLEEIYHNTIHFSLPLDDNYAYNSNKKQISGYLKIVSEQNNQSITYNIQANIEKNNYFYIAFAFIILLALLWYRFKLGRQKI